MKFCKYILLSASLLAGATSCSDELSGTDWSAGEASNAPGIYFSPDNETYMALLDGDGTVASLKVRRIDNQGALTVPVVVKSAGERMQIPASITFADGSYETTLDVECADSPAVVDLPLVLTFPDEYINPYAAGTPVYNGKIIVSRWENVSDTGTIDVTIVDWSFKDAGYQPIPSEMYHLLGSDRYRIKNFVNSEIDFTFDLVKSPLRDNYYRIVPVGNQLTLADYGWGDYSYYNSWWLVSDNFETADEDDEDEGWGVGKFFRTDGTEFDVYYIEFFWYDDSTKTEYCYVLNYDTDKPTAYMAFYGYTDEDMEQYAPYLRIRFSWNK